eukprot:g9749.t1
MMTAVLCGNVGSGKSTLLGHMLCLCGVFDRRYVDQIRREEHNDARYLYVRLVQSGRNERNRGATNDVRAWSLSTPNRQYTIFDPPSHRYNEKQKSQVGIVLVEAGRDEFEAGWRQTCEHLSYLAATCVRLLLVCVNKMDSVGVHYSEQRYLEIKAQILNFVQILKFAHVVFVPISATEGDNLVRRSRSMPWWHPQTLEEKNKLEVEQELCVHLPAPLANLIYMYTLAVWDGTVLGVLDSMPVPKQPVDLDLRFVTQDVYLLEGKMVVVGTVEAGLLRPGDSLVFAPGLQHTRVLQLERQHERLEQAAAGDREVAVMLDLSAAHTKTLRRGHVAGHPHNPPKAVAAFKTHVQTYSYAELKNHQFEIRPGYAPVVDCHTAHVVCRVEKVLYLVDPCNGRRVPTDGDCVPTVKAGKQAGCCCDH